MGRKGTGQAGDARKLIGVRARGLTTRRRLVAGALGGLPLVAITACDTANKGGSAAGDAPNAKPTALTSPVTIDVAWERTGTEVGQFVAGRAREIFEQRHPGVTVNIISGGNTQDKILAQAAGGTPPHVLNLNVNLPASYVAQNLLMPLDTLIQKSRDAAKADFVPNMWDAFTIQGKQYGLPREGGPTVMYYNKALVEAGGVAAPTENWTLAEQYREASVRLTKPGEPNARPAVFGTNLDGSWRNWVYSNGGEILDAAGTRYTLDQGPAVEALQLHQDFRYRLNAATTPQDEQQQASLQRFIAGGLALFPGLRWMTSTAGFIQPHVGIAQHPRGKAGRRFTMPANGVGLLQPNKQPDISWEVAKWLVSAELQKLHYSLGIGGVVARQTVLQSDEYLNSAIPRQWNEFFAKGMADLKAPPKHPKWPEIDSTIGRELMEFEHGRENAAAATARIAPIVQSLLR